MQAIVVFLAIHIIVVLSSINNTAVSVAFPDITASYNTSLVLAGWVLSIYQLVAVCSMVLMGKISDVLGRKRTLLICSTLFILGSLLAAVAPSIQVLIVARFIQSAGGGGTLPTTMGIILDLFPRQRERAVGFGMALFNLGGIIGPNIGAWLITSFGWHSIFWFNVPIGILSIIPIFFLLRSEPGEKAHIDFAGAAFFTAFIFAFMIGLSEVAHARGATWIAVAALFIISGVSIFVFVRHEFRASEPIVDLELLRSQPFVSANVYNFIFGACIFGFASFIPLYAVSVYDMTTVESSYVLMTRAVGMIVATTISGFFLVRWGYRKPMLIGTVLLSISLLLLGAEFSGLRLFGTSISSLVLLSGLALTMGIGTGLATPASNIACLDLRPERASTVTGVRGMFRQGGGAIGVAVVTLILQYTGSIPRGFNIVYTATGMVVLLTIPFIFGMPARARAMAAAKSA